MAKWQCDIPTKREFIHRLERAPELILVRGVLHGRFGLQSLPTVLDEFREVFVTNTRFGWGISVLRSSRNRFVVTRLPMPRSGADAGRQ
jgi:hypothetical protein